MGHIRQAERDIRRKEQSRGARIKEKSREAKDGARRKEKSREERMG